MVAFIDSSVLIRKLFGEPQPLAEWGDIEVAYACRLLPLELGRVIDRARLEGRISDEQVAQAHDEARRILRSIHIVALTEPILRRAAGPMPTVVGSLDALHLCSALEVAASLDDALVFATHDAQLGRAARAFGLDVLGT